MKLGIKLLAAPLLTALVVFSVGQLTRSLVSQQTSQVEQTILSQSDDYRTLSNAQEQIAQIHTGVYRNLGLIGAMDAAQIKQLRTDMAQQLAGFKRVVQGASSISERDAKSLQAVTDLVKLADQYAGQIDQAVGSSSAETGAGAGFAVMREADVTFAALASATRSLIQHVDELSEASVAVAQRRAKTIELEVRPVIALILALQTVARVEDALGVEELARPGPGDAVPRGAGVAKHNVGRPVVKAGGAVRFAHYAHGVAMNELSRNQQAWYCPKLGEATYAPLAAWLARMTAMEWATRG